MGMDSPGTGATPAGTAARSGSGSEEGGLADRLRDRASGALSQQKHRATEGLGSIVDAVRSTGRQLGDTDRPGIAKYVNNAADSLQQWADAIDRKDVREIVEDVQQFGRRRPALFVGISFGAGLLGARFLKSSARGEHRSYDDASVSYGERDTAASGERGGYSAQRSAGTVRGTNYGSAGHGSSGNTP
jgi:hypothetical protein